MPPQPDQDKLWSLRNLVRLAALFVLVTSVVWALLAIAWQKSPVDIHVRWTADVTDAQRADLERRFQLTAGEYREGTTWRYQLADSSTTNIRELIQNPSVDDTEHLNRIRYRPEFGQDRPRQMMVYSVGIGAIGSLFLFVLLRWRPAAFALPSRSELVASLSAGSSTVAAFEARRAATSVIGGLVTAFILSWLFDAPLGSVAAALMVVYAGGYVAGALLLDRPHAGDGLSWIVIRTVAGLLMTTIGFLLSLVLSAPWFLLPSAVIAVALWLRGRSALVWPAVARRLRWDDCAAVILALVILSPILITFPFMAPGSFPPVLYNIDTAYALEKVHALAASDSYPPDSLSNLGIRRTYHYGTQAMAALISRTSGLPPHQSMFLIVMPLLAIGVIAAAAAAVRHINPALPRSVTVPFLLISTPSPLSPLWSRFVAHPWATTGTYDVWGILSNEGPNVGSDFLILGTIAGIAAASSWGWALPAFLIGSALIVKTTAGVALFAGFVLTEAWRAVSARRLRISPQLVITAAVFVMTAAAFFLVSFESNFRVELFPFFHVREVAGRGNLGGVALDTALLFLPALLVLSAGTADPEKRSVPFLLMALGPLVIVNVTRMDNTRAGGGGTGDDWFQMLHTVPFMLHAFAVSLAGRRWDRLGPPLRAAFVAILALMIAPVSIAATRYSLMVLRVPGEGNDFVDNRALAEALAAIPTTGTVIVTNDLRYPAGHFTRDYRQMQIPALYGHQAYAVNYAHEAVEERRPLQEMLQQTEWSEAILDAARMHRWTHFLVRNDYPHPAVIPLEKTFESDVYSVYRFP